MHEKTRQSRDVRRELLLAMHEGQYARCSRLPRECVLAQELGISRTQLRDVLASLDREGFITRRHGVGTLINRHVLAARGRMDIEVEFQDMIRQEGFTPGLAFVRAQEEAADPHIARRLAVPVGTAVMKIARLCTADGRPAIYCEDVLEVRRILRPFTDWELHQPIFDFLQNVCGLTAYLDLTDLQPVAARGETAALLQVPEGTALLYMDEVDYDRDGAPLFASSQYFPGGIFRHTMLRKRL